MVRMIAEDVGKSRKQVMFVIRNFEDRLATILRDPVSYTKYVLLEWFGRFKLKDKKVEKKYWETKEWKPKSREFIFYNALMDKYYVERKGQTDFTNYDAGCSDSEVS